MATKQRDPNVDYGFRAVIPRMVRTEYKDLTPTQRWLYVCLKDLCGDTGTCYRTLRVLAEETGGISIAMLSESIRKLHEVGLIHAEKKKRSTGGKEVWHITIVDIWEANGKLHPSKRSPNEQTSENVHLMNENVHSANKTGVECSPNERECSPNETGQSDKPASSQASSGQNQVVSIDNGSKNSTEVRTEKSSQPAATNQFFLSEQEQSFWQLWLTSKVNKDSLRLISISESASGHIKRLAPLVTTAETLESLIDFSQERLNASDKKINMFTSETLLVIMAIGSNHKKFLTMEPSRNHPLYPVTSLQKS